MFLLRLILLCACCVRCSKGRQLNEKEADPSTTFNCSPLQKKCGDTVDLTKIRTDILPVLTSDAGTIYFHPCLPDASYFNICTGDAPWRLVPMDFSYFDCEIHEENVTLIYNCNPNSSRVKNRNPKDDTKDDNSEDGEDSSPIAIQFHFAVIDKKYYPPYIKSYENKTVFVEWESPGLISVPFKDWVGIVYVAMVVIVFFLLCI